MAMRCDLVVCPLSPEGRGGGAVPFTTVGSSAAGGIKGALPLPLGERVGVRGQCT
jgi:hypothetical protein